MIFTRFVGEHAVAAPGCGAATAVDAAAVPLVAVFEVADPSLAAGAPFDLRAERGPAFVLLAGRAGSAFSRDGNGFHAKVVQVLLDGGVAVAAGRRWPVVACGRCAQ